MARNASPVVRRRRLAMELRRLRARANKTLDEVATYLECSATKISRIETGQVGIRPRDVRDLLDLYEVHGPRRDELLDLAGQARQKAWWSPYLDAVPPDFGIFLGLEDEASRIWTYETIRVPGLLQTEQYARAFLESVADVPLDIVDRRLEVRLTRQKILAREDPPHLHVIMNEAALRQVIGGRDVMLGQYRHLLEVASLPTVKVQLIPFESGTCAALGMDHTIFGFADPGAPNVVYLDELDRSYFIEDAGSVGHYLGAFNDLRGHALSVTDSASFVASILDEAERR